MLAAARARASHPWRRPVLAALLLALAAGCRTPAAPARALQLAQVEQTLDALHAAAAAADEEAYFGLFAEGAVFLGTDPEERWSLADFRAWARPHFAAGRGWTYVPLERHVTLSEGLDTAWFDERLSNASYGECRGTGVLRREGSGWRVAQYSLSLPVPNDLAGDLVDRIRASGGG